MLKTLNSLQINASDESILDLEKKLQEKPTPQTQVAPKNTTTEMPAIHEASGQPDPWKTLKIKLNSYSTKAPLFAMAYERAGGDSEKMMEHAQRLNTFHQKTSELIAKDLWQGDPPPSAFAVVGRSVSESMQDIWKGNAAGENLSPPKVANMITGLMPEINVAVDKLFTKDNHVPLPAITEAAVGVKMLTKINSTVGTQAESFQKVFLNEETITSLTQQLVNDVTTKSKEVSGAITVHKKMPPQDPLQQDIAYQSTLKTFGKIYEQSLQIAFNDILSEVTKVGKEGTSEEKQAYLKKAAESPRGQLYNKASKISGEIVEIVYGLTKKQEAEPEVTDNQGPRM